MGTSTVATIFSGFVGDLSSNLSTNLPAVLTVAAALIGLGILVHYVRKWIGRK